MSEEAPKKILIVDDEEDILYTMTIVLEKKGYEVTTASNGVLALEAVKKQIPDLILSDVLMPEMDGFQFFKELKEAGETADLPVLIVTARPLMEDTFSALGADGFISKPFTPEELCKKIEHILTVSEEKNKNQKGLSKIIRKKVLIAGEKSVITSEMAALVEKAGYKVRVAAKGSEIIAETVKFFPDVIALDLHTEELSSEDVIATLRSLPQFGKKPIILYAYYTTKDLESPTTRQKILRIQEISNVCLKAGATRYIGRYNHEAFTKALFEELSEAQI